MVWELVQEKREEGEPGAYGGALAEGRTAASLRAGVVIVCGVGFVGVLFGVLVGVFSADDALGVDVFYGAESRVHVCVDLVLAANVDGKTAGGCAYAFNQQQGGFAGCESVVQGFELSGRGVVDSRETCGHVFA